ncbi:hypothetical protein SAMN06297468_1862 [Altererythrobacter xiamenensis]|uniref:Lysylphosphatidylglycerol synthase TM region n=1 Tax=Altererythrobacter xiamenensis TaxID=1316679 RepID=A0A1Y6F469_9SPHN|nr:hypothetical protein [Altererythrobacter xiamenensis]SMQ69675.1 hypothetical protein SAMN06297468_1862 [Altererythrobacter xiamenensis]
MKRLIYFLGTILFITSLVFVGLYLRENWSGTIQIPLTSLAISSVLYSLTHFTTSLSWMSILRATGNELPFKSGIAINMVSQAAKYIPGNFAHHLGRAFLAKEIGLPLKVSAYVLPIEIGCVCFASLLVGGFLFSYWISIACFAALAALLLTGYRKYVFPILSLAFGLLLAGISLAILVDEPRAIAAYSIAWLIGFLLPGAPAGIGVREVALVALLEKSISPEILASAIIVHRLLTAAVDGLIAAIAYFVTLASIQRRAAKKEPTIGK